MSAASERYHLWITDPAFDEKTREELLAIRQNTKEIEDRFYKYLEFGTAGLRGVLGAGTNRMNVYTVARATEGFARHLDTLGQTAKERVLPFPTIPAASRLNSRACRPPFSPRTASRYSCPMSFGRSRCCPSRSVTTRRLPAS